jgi:myosin heavy subunit
MQATRRSMTLVGIPLPQQDAVFRLVAAVLHLGNLMFQEDSDRDTSTIQVSDKQLCIMTLPSTGLGSSHILDECFA